MAAAAAVTHLEVSIDDYLNGRVPEPDVEYIDGELRERPLVQYIHGRLQTIIGCWFENHADAWGVVAAVEVRTRVTPKRVRLPDIVVLEDRPWPGTLDTPPLIAIEIVSPNETFTELLEKFFDYNQMGIANTWVVDPQLRRAWVFGPTGLLATERFTVHDTPIYLDLNETFARHDRSR